MDPATASGPGSSSGSSTTTATAPTTASGSGSSFPTAAPEWIGTAARLPGSGTGFGSVSPGKCFKYHSARRRLPASPASVDPSGHLRRGRLPASWASGAPRAWRPSGGLSGSFRAWRSRYRFRLPASRESVSNIIQHGDGFQLPAARRRPGFLDPAPAPAPASRRRPRNGSGRPADPARKRRIFSEGVLYNIYNYQIAWIYRPFSGSFSGFQATAPAPAPADGSGPGFRLRLQLPRKPFPPVKTARRKIFCRGKCSKIRASSASGQVFCRLAEKKLLTGTNPGVIIPTEPGNKPRNRTTKRREQEQ